MEYYEQINCTLYASASVNYLLVTTLAVSDVTSRVFLNLSRMFGKYE